MLMYCYKQHYANEVYYYGYFITHEYSDSETTDMII